MNIELVSRGGSVVVELIKMLFTNLHHPLKMVKIWVKMVKIWIQMTKSIKITIQWVIIMARRPQLKMMIKSNIKTKDKGLIQ